MAAKKKSTKSIVNLKTSKNSFAAFLANPMISTALILFGLIALFFAILEFTEAIAI